MEKPQRYFSLRLLNERINRQNAHNRSGCNTDNVLAYVCCSRKCWLNHTWDIRCGLVFLIVT